MVFSYWARSCAGRVRAQELDQRGVHLVGRSCWIQWPAPSIGSSAEVRHEGLHLVERAHAERAVSTASRVPAMNSAGWSIVAPARAPSAPVAVDVAVPVEPAAEAGALILGGEHVELGPVSQDGSGPDRSTVRGSPRAIRQEPALCARGRRPSRNTGCAGSRRARRARARPRRHPAPGSRPSSSRTAGLPQVFTGGIGRPRRRCGTLMPTDRADEVGPESAPRATRPARPSHGRRSRRLCSPSAATSPTTSPTVSGWRTPRRLRRVGARRSRARPARQPESPRRHERGSWWRHEYQSSGQPWQQQHQRARAASVTCSSNTVRRDHAAAACHHSRTSLIRSPRCPLLRDMRHQNERPGKHAAASVWLVALVSI